MQHLLSTTAQAQLEAYKRTQQIDTTEELFNEVYELIANDSVNYYSEPDADEQVYDTVMQSIKEL
jgi:hypothetical protein